MQTLFEIKDVDRRVYQEQLEAFLPDNIIDIHAHVWLRHFRMQSPQTPKRTVSWPSRVANDNSLEDLLETYKLMFPGKKVTPLIFTTLKPGDKIEEANAYISDCSFRTGVPGLIWACPWWSAEELETKIGNGGFLGAKVYLTFSPEYIPQNELRIYDFLPHHQLEVLDRLGLIVMLHIPRKDRLKDPVNQQQLLEIHNRYKNLKVIIAHVGRAYCNHDLGNAFEVLKNANRLLYDFSANTNSWIFEQLIKAVGPKRILFGSDLPILRMRMKRIEKDGIYVNIVPKGLYGDVTGDKNMAEIEGEEADKLTFFMYEELAAFRKAAEATALSRNDIMDIFFNNAVTLIKTVAPNRTFRFE
ncbi:MAG: amidohydrolase family protein [Sedimentisphaerales bacterium]|nr:amidohydrolase family protein [Sedimentisphaerales bacterium]